MRYDWSDLKTLYIDQKLSSEDIAKLKGCSGVRVREVLKRQSISMRTRKEAGLLAFTKTGHKRPRMSLNPNWKGGRYKTKHGYIAVYMPDHPFARGKGYVFEHRLVVEKRIGRYLLPSEKVHHKDGIRDHNVDENLELISIADHRIRNWLCSGCPLRKQIALLTSELKTALQGKLGLISEPIVLDKTASPD